MNKCIICGSNKHKIDVNACRILGLPENIKVLTCNHCKIKKLTPYLSDSELDRMYSNVYFKSEGNFTYLGHEINPPKDNYSTLTTAIRLNSFRYIYNKLKNYYPESKTFIDIGASTGEGMKVAKDFWTTVDGIELSQDAINIAKSKHGLSINQSSLEEVNVNSYDIIFLSHVFEHFTDPISSIMKLKSIMSKDSLCYIEIPYQFNLVVKCKQKFLNKPNDFTVHSIHHPYFYSYSNFIYLLSKSGFKIINSGVFRPLEHKGFIKKILWYILSYFKIGNIIYAYVKKS